MELQKWKKKGSRVVFDKRVKLIEYEVVLPNGEDSMYLVESAGPAVAVLSKIGKDEVLLVQQYRFPLDRWIYDLPAGRTQKDEPLEVGVRRECLEETGHELGVLIYLGKFYPNPGRSDWPAHLFFSEESKKVVEPKVDDSSELPKVVAMPLHELKQKIEKGEIVDPSLIISFYLAQSKGLL